jgi:hypothetical protein
MNIQTLVDSGSVVVSGEDLVLVSGEDSGVVVPVTVVSLSVTGSVTGDGLPEDGFAVIQTNICNSNMIQNISMATYRAGWKLATIASADIEGLEGLLMSSKHVMCALDAQSRIKLYGFGSFKKEN